MNFIRYTKNKESPFFRNAALLSLFSCLFLIIYSYINYQNYIKYYITSQNSEIEAANERTNKFVDDFKGLLSLTVKRLKASPNDNQQIQKILASSDLFSLNLILPAIQKFSYYKLSPSPLLITRFGVVPFPLNRYPSRSLMQEGAFVNFQGEKVLGKSIVVDEQNNLAGILEAQIDFSDLKTLIGNLATIYFEGDSTSKPIELQKSPFPLYAKSPLSFVGFVFNTLSYYMVFCVYGLICLFLLIFSFFSAHRYFERRYTNVIKDLEKLVSEKTGEIEKLENDLEQQNYEHQNHLLSCQSLKTFYTQQNKRQNDQASLIERSLDVVNASLQHGTVYLSDFEREELLESCMVNARSLSNHSLSVVKEEKVDLKKSLENTQKFFAEKLYKSNILVKTNCPADLFIQNDRFLIEFVLLNLIGKAIYRVPKNGKIVILAFQHEDGSALEIQDNGYSLTNMAENLIKKSFDFFMEEDLFQKLCLESGILYEHSREEKSTNLTKVTFNHVRQDTLPNNVVPLFEKNS